MHPIKIALVAGALVLGTGAVFAQSLEGTARTHFTTSSGVSNFSHNRTGANTPLRGVYTVAVVEKTVVVRKKRHRH